MTKKNSRSNVMALAWLMLVGLVLFGGCVPIDRVGLDAFMGDLLLSAAAAFLL